MGSIEDQQRTETKHVTYPMIRAAAVRMYLPSPSGFAGTGETSKVGYVGEGALASGLPIVLPLFVDDI
jgi:hypothetical protein